MTDDKNSKHPWHDMEPFEPQLVRKGGGGPPSAAAALPIILVILFILITMSENGG